MKAAAGHNVGKGVVHEAAIAAAVVSCVAVNQFLFRQFC